jgi:hypothetical protein
MLFMAFLMEAVGQNPSPKLKFTGKQEISGRFYSVGKTFLSGTSTSGIRETLWEINSQGH